MCTGMELLMIGGSAFSALGQITQGSQQKQMYHDQAQATVNNAAIEADSYTAQAEKIRKAGKTQVGEANAALAASGVKIGQGSALEVEKNIRTNVEQDALSAILSGTRTTTAAQQESKMLQKAGSNAQTNAMFGVGSTVLSAGAEYVKSGWKKAATQGA